MPSIWTYEPVNASWSYHHVLPYLKTRENDADFRDAFHGTDGPVPVRRFPRETWPPMQEAFYRACVAADFPESPDVQQPDATGLSLRAENTVDGVRMSTALTYLQPSRHRLNLTIRPQVLVRRLLFAGTPATGVEGDSGGARFRLDGQELVLSAGAVASPHRLLRSGVGPQEALRALGLPLGHHLPGVGQNLRDHPNVHVRLRLKSGVPEDDLARRAVRLRSTAAGSSTPHDMRLSPASLNTVHATGQDPSHTMNCGRYLAVGSGTLALTSADPAGQPAMHYRSLEAPWDLQRLRDGVRLCVRLLDDPAFQAMLDQRVSPTDAELAADAALDQWLVPHVTSASHLAGTCKMGPASAPMAVVDQWCRVHGLSGLRVADASRMPDVVRAHTNVTTMRIAERGAEFITAGP